MLEAQLLCDYIDVTDLFPNSLTHGTFSFFGQISVVMDRFGHSLRFSHLELDKEAILMVAGVNITGIGGCFLNLRELSFCSPCGPCFNIFFSHFTYVINFYAMIDVIYFHIFYSYNF